MTGTRFWADYRNAFFRTTPAFSAPRTRTLAPLFEERLAKRRERRRAEAARRATDDDWFIGQLLRAYPRPEPPARKRLRHYMYKALTITAAVGGAAAFIGLVVYAAFTGHGPPPVAGGGSGVNPPSDPTSAGPSAGESPSHGGQDDSGSGSS